MPKRTTTLSIDAVRRLGIWCNSNMGNRGINFDGLLNIAESVQQDLESNPEVKTLRKRVFRMERERDISLNTIDSAREQLAAFLCCPIENYEEVSLGGMINCLATKVAFDPQDRPRKESKEQAAPKLKDQFVEGYTRQCFVLEPTDTLEQAILGFLKAEGTLSFQELKERLDLGYSGKWKQSYIRTLLCQMASDGRVGVHKTDGEPNLYTINFYKKRCLS